MTVAGARTTRSGAPRAPGAVVSATSDPDHTVHRPPAPVRRGRRGPAPPPPPDVRSLHPPLGCDGRPPPRRTGRLVPTHPVQRRRRPRLRPPPHRPSPRRRRPPNASKRPASPPACAESASMTYGTHSPPDSPPPASRYARSKSSSVTPTSRAPRSTHTTPPPRTKSAWSTPPSRPTPRSPSQATGQTPSRVSLKCELEDLAMNEAVSLDLREITSFDDHGVLTENPSCSMRAEARWEGGAQAR